MKVKRQELLDALVSVRSGLDQREVIEQSNHFGFRDGKVWTYNDEIAVCIDSPIELDGAVLAGPLLALLGRLDDEELEMTTTEGELRFKGKRGRRGGVKMAEEVTLPIDSVETPDEWKELPAEFVDAIKVAAPSCGRDESRFVLTCLHVGPDVVEATDNFQMTRYPLETGFDKSTLIPSGSVRNILGLDLREFALTDSWAHFKDSRGLVYSCRAYFEDYPDLSPFEDFEGEETTLPDGLQDATQRAEVFTASATLEDALVVSIKEGVLTLRGENESGWYEETTKVSFEGDALEFSISPTLLRDLVKKTKTATVGEGRIKVETDHYRHTVCTAIVE